ncbi:hypothetical protein [Brevibacillus porteri]|uniref:hypothetical protein n=1 Tax=Brevibacillus porteri TaxID=2126350 RepID=UPI003D209F6A
MMEAGRELDAKVAEALGWSKVHCKDDEFFHGWLGESPEGQFQLIPHFSTSWESMGVLVEEARKKKILLRIVPETEGYTCSARSDDDTRRLLGLHTDLACPVAASKAFLHAMDFKVLMGI